MPSISMPAAWTRCAACRLSLHSMDGSHELRIIRSGEPCMIVVDDLHKAFKTKAGIVQAVQGVSFEAADGQITGLLGPNGAGKTTTLRMLYTLMAPDQGQVRVDGIDVAHDPLAVRRALGVLPDARGVYKRLTARENIAYFGELHGLSAARIVERTRLLSAALDMDDILDRQTEGFSQGQRTKTAIARALVHDPRNVILDEPTNGLDVMTTRALRGFLRGLRAQGRCVIFSSHIMQEVAALCDRIVIVANGTVVAAGTADELRALTGEDNLEDAFVKAIGSEEGLHA
ncbi:ABC transporter ATP-binding protein [Xanthomonas albilineans]|uniref:ABC transporter ATP-binding protein n=2 Tax=Xanthomonas albilineans TaxID=29447 RepID=UPI00387E63AB